MNCESLVYFEQKLEDLSESGKVGGWSGQIGVSLDVGVGFGVGGLKSWRVVRSDWCFPWR